MSLPLMCCSVGLFGKNDYICHVMLTDEARLLDKISQGDEIAFSGLFTYYYPKVITFLSELIALQRRAIFISLSSQHSANSCQI